MTSAFQQVAVGSIVAITVPGTRSTDGEPREIPAIVLAQDPEDGVLSLFAFHFEGQYHASVPVRTQKYRIEVEDGKEVRVPYWESNVKVVYDAGRASVKFPDLEELRATVADDIQTLQRQMSEFQEQVLSMITQPAESESAEPVGVESARGRRKP